MRAVVFQEEGVGGFPSREELIEVWREELRDVPQIERIEFYNKMRRETDPEQAIGDAEIVLGTYITDGFLNEAFLDRHPKLNYISTQSHGFGRIDMELLRKRKIVFTNTVYGDRTIAQFAFALLLDICHDVGLHDNYYRTEYWKEDHSSGITSIQSRQIELYGKTFGIVGLGTIGLCAARIAAAFGMNVVAYSRNQKTGAEYDLIEQVSFEELLARSHVISLHCPLTEQTRGLINSDIISKMKDGVILLNTARGEIVDEDALAQALRSGKVYAAGLDVLAGEPLNQPSVLMACPNVRVTPHMAWAPAEAKVRSVRMEAETLKKWLRGEPIRNFAK